MSMPLATANGAEYFAAIERHLNALRGSARLLSPADYQVASRWFRENVPLALVLRTLDELFEKRRQRGATDPINTLRYCANAVDREWRMVRELQGPQRRPPVVVEAPTTRLEDLAAALPGCLRVGWGARVMQLAGTPDEIEMQLRALDDSLLAEVDAALTGDERTVLEREVGAILEGLRDRFEPGELEALRPQLHRQRLRRRLDLPVLTLF